MTKIINSTPLNADVTQLALDAPLIAAKAQPGQFVMLRLDADGERFPLTIARAERETGAVTLVVQRVGKSTARLAAMQAGEVISDMVGPLGEPTHLDGITKAAVIGGGLGCAIAWPIARALKERGAEVHMIAGFRNRDLMILQSELAADCTELHVCTDDGSYGYHGFVTGKLEELAALHRFDHVFAIGPLPMMKFTSKLTKQLDIPTTVSMNPIMVDGTGMCGGCRVTVGGETKFACVDGPDFDGHLVDFDETIRRNAAYHEFEQRRYHEHCRLGGTDHA